MGLIIIAIFIKKYKTNVILTSISDRPMILTCNKINEEINTNVLKLICVVK